MNSRVLSGGARKGVIQTSVAVGVAVAVAGMLAACGGSTGSTPAAASTPTAAASTSGNAAYLDCLRQHGANIPTSFPSRTRPTNRPTGVRPSGGFGGGGGGGFFGQSQSPQLQAAMQACVSVRPTGGFGGFGGGRGGTQLVAFRNCMTQQGVAIPTTRPTAFPTATSSADRSARYLNGLDPNDPKVAAALKVCSPLLPTARPSGAPTG